MYFPISRKELRDIVCGKKIRCTVWTIQHMDIPMVTITWNKLLHHALWNKYLQRLERANMQHIAKPQCPSCMSPKLA